jgi:hypothetical protein
VVSFHRVVKHFPVVLMTVGNLSAPLSGHWSHPAGESLQGLWDTPGSASPKSQATARIFRRMETSEPSGCATLAAEDGYPLQPQDSFEICFASPGFFSGGFRETSSKPGTLTNIEAVDGKGVGGSLTGQGANITHFQCRCWTLFSHHDEIEVIQIEKR